QGVDQSGGLEEELFFSAEPSTPQDASDLRFEATVRKRFRQIEEPFQRGASQVELEDAPAGKIALRGSQQAEKSVPEGFPDGTPLVLAKPRRAGRLAV